MLLKILIAILGLLNLPAGLAAVEALKLVSALPIEGPANNQPSGLTIEDDRLLTVSDKHDHTIYELIVGDKVVTQAPWARLDTLPESLGPLDLEGIASDGSGNLYLVSECKHRAILHSGGKTQWLTPSLESIGEDVGLFQTRGADFEAIAVMQPMLYLFAERQPRGIISYDLQDGTVRPSVNNETRFALKTGRLPDFAGAFSVDNRLFVLHRNAHIVSELVNSGGQWQEGTGYSYAAVENDQRYAYSDMRFGLGEGLAMNARFVFIVLDNNGDSRVDGDDRPMLLILDNPFLR
jgi:hypothetical protein